MSAKEPKISLPSVEDDERELAGLWIQPREPGYAPRVLRITSGGSMMVCDFGALGDASRVHYLGFYLEEVGGDRLMLNEDQEGVVLFKYRLEGDRLELEGSRVHDSETWNLTGTWLRLTYNNTA